MQHHEHQQQQKQHQQQQGQQQQHQEQQQQQQQEQQQQERQQQQIHGIGVSLTEVDLLEQQQPSTWRVSSKTENFANFSCTSASASHLAPKNNPHAFF
ncbi:hypothetical protein ACSSS7_004242 [Eimeria intestinalis]